MKRGGFSDEGGGGWIWLGLICLWLRGNFHDWWFASVNVVKGSFESK